MTTPSYLHHSFLVKKKKKNSRIPMEAIRNLAAEEESPFAGKVFSDLTEPDVHVVTSGRRRIPAHSDVLASVSPVLEKIMEKPKKFGSSKKAIQILGVPCDAVSAFIGFLYSFSLTQGQIEKYGIHLLALSHVYMVAALKRLCTAEVGRRLTAENVVDVLQLARLCDAPDLCLRCMRLIYNQFKAVEATDGWKFLQHHDPRLELEILQFIDDAESRKRRTRRNKKQQSLYLQLHEAMDRLEHIYTEGCTVVGPRDVVPNKIRPPCRMFATCQGLQLLIKHFATCKNRARCLRCKRMWQLLELHSSTCEQPVSCRVPLCRQFMIKKQEEMKRGEDTRWERLVRRVISVKAMSSLSQSNKKKDDENIEEPNSVLDKFIL